MTQAKTPPAEARVHTAAKRLRDIYPFVTDGWDYTRNIGDLTEIRYNRPSDQFWGRKGRLASGLSWLNPSRHKWALNRDEGYRWRYWWRIRMFLFVLKRDKNLPDGVLAGGNVITFWEEYGEYIQLMQPSIGDLLADLMDAHPDLPEVQALAAEQDRITKRYRERNRSKKDAEV